MKFFTDAKLRAGSMLREWKEKREEQKAARAALAHSEHGHGRFFLLTIPATATICAAIVEVYWALLFCIEATGRLDWNFDFASASSSPLTFVWNFAFNGNAPVLIGLLAATAPIVMISMVWLPVQFAMRGHGAWRRGSLIAAGLLCNAIVIISGTVVMNHNRQDQVRSALVIEQSADADRAAIGARLQVAQTELARITAEGNTSNEARAARAGVAGWQTYVREANSDPDVPAADRQRIARAMGSAEAADRLRARIEELTVQQATSAPTANTAVTVNDSVGQGMNAFAEQVKVYRPPLIAVACTIIGILGAWWTLAMLLHMNPKDVLRSGWADEAHRIEDLREEEPVVPQPMRPAREVVTDAETGEELQRITPKPYWRKNKGKKQRVETTPEIPPDETGFEDSRTATSGVTLGGVMELPENDLADQQESADGHDERARHRSEETEVDVSVPDGAPGVVEVQTANSDEQSLDQPEPPSQDFEELAAQVAAEEQADDAGADEDATPDAAHEPLGHHETPEREEPETRDERLLPSHVAAE